MYDTPRSKDELISMLASAPSHIAELIEDLTLPELLTPPEPDAWSLRDIIAHLRSCSDMWGKYILLILSEDHPTFKAVNPTTWIKQTNYQDLPFEPSFHAYSTQRTELIGVLTPLAPEDWERSATVTGAGRPRERTVYTYAQWLANHEKSHFKQIKKTSDALR